MLQLHPSILIGYGSYGRRVLRRLLTDAEAHGMLVWEDVPFTGGPTARRLKNLALLYVPERPGTGEEGVQGDLARDLYQQIQEIASEEGDLRKAVLDAKGLLLNVSARSPQQDRLRLGLDVYVMAQPAKMEILGTLGEILQPVMDEISNDPGLRRPAQGSDLLNFILVLDFENFWDASNWGREIRHEVHSSVQRWEDRVLAGRPGFGRIYLIDGHTSDGYKDEEVRIDEVTLFLEFALFAGMRDDQNLRRIYQRENDSIQPLATFGIRVIERSHGLLKRLVAAYFASKWLGYMAGSQAASEQQAHTQLGVFLADFRPDSLDMSEPRAELTRKLEEGIAELERELMALPIDEEDWPKKVRARVPISILRLKVDLASWAAQRAQQIASQRLGDLPQKLQAAITHALHNQTALAPLGAVINELENLQVAFEQEPSKPTPSPPAVEWDNAFSTIDDIHGEYEHFKRTQVNANRLADWWLLLGIVLAASWTPILVEAIDDLPRPDANSMSVLHAAYQLLTLTGRPIFAAPLLFLAAWAIGRYGFHRSIQARVKRGLLTFTHPDRGRIVNRVRGLLRSSRLRVSLEAYVDQVFQNMVGRLHSEVLNEIDHARDRLEMRRKELEWLRNELRRFLGTYGLDPDRSTPSFGVARNQRPGCRFSTETDEDLQRLLRRNLATRERFESVQASLKPFAGWNERYSDSFLYPVIFLEKLSREYEEGDVTHHAPSSQKFTEFLQRFGQFSCAIGWDSGGGAGADPLQPYCVIPESWKSMKDAVTGLSDYGFGPQRVLSGPDLDRCYLLRLQLGVSPERLDSTQL